MSRRRACPRPSQNHALRCLMGKPFMADIRLVRRHARTLGISIRTRRSSKSRPEPTYDLIDSAGHVLHRGVALADIESTLGTIARRPEAITAMPARAAEPDDAAEPEHTGPVRSHEPCP